jgi:hypothetical protein
MTTSDRLDHHSRLRGAVAALALGACLALPGGAIASGGDAQPMTGAESYQLTCGHLGVPCDQPAKPRRRHGSKVKRARTGARHSRRPAGRSQRKASAATPRPD